MNMLKAGVRNETVKLLSKKKYKALLVMLFILCIAAGMLGGFTKGLIGLSLTNMPLTLLSIATKFLFPLMIALAAADTFTAEQEDGSIKAVITRPISRINIFNSKVLAIVLYIIFALLVCLVASLVSDITFNGIESLNIGETILAYTVSIMPMLPIVLFAVAISQFCKNSSSTVMLSVFIYIVIAFIGVALPSSSPMLFVSYTGWYKLFIGESMPFTSILNMLVLLVAYTLIFYAAGSWAFEKKEY